MEKCERCGDPDVTVCRCVHLEEMKRLTAALVGVRLELKKLLDELPERVRKVLARM